MEDTELNAKLSELEELLLPKDSAERRFEGSVDEFGRGRLVGETSSATSGSENRFRRTCTCRLGEAGSTASGAVCGSGRTRGVGEVGSGRTRRVGEVGSGRRVGEAGSTASGAVCGSGRTRGVGEAGSGRTRRVGEVGSGRRVGEAGSGRTRRVGEVGSGRRVGEAGSGSTRRVGGAGSAVSGGGGCEFSSTVSGAKITSGRPTAGESGSRASGFTMLSLSRRASVLSQTATSASPSLPGGDLIEGDTAFALLSCTDSNDLQ